jgi:hypothetical protein
MCKKSELESGEGERKMDRRREAGKRGKDKVAGRGGQRETEDERTQWATEGGRQKWKESKTPRVSSQNTSASGDPLSDS